jgi:MFS family permease
VTDLYEPADPDAVTPVATGRGAWRKNTFAALENKEYRRLWIGGLISFLAVQMEFISRGWLAFRLTGSNAGLGAVYLGFGVPMLLLTPWGGVAADRLPKRAVLMGCQLTLAASSLTVAMAEIFGFMSYPLLIGTAVLQGAGFSFLGPARMAFTGELVGRERLGNAVVLQQMSMNGTRVFGPSLAGVLIGIPAFGVGGVYLMTSMFMLGAVWNTSRLPHGRPDPTRELLTPLREMGAGIRYVRDRTQVLILVLTSLIVVMFAFPYVAFLPTLADRVFDVGSSGYGLMSGASAIGALAASLFIAGKASGPSAVRIQIVCGILFGLGVAVLGHAPTFVIGLLLITLIGAASSGFQSLNNSLVLDKTDLAYHGRVQSLMMLSFSGFGMMALPLGAIADSIGITTTMGFMGGIAATAVVISLLLRRRDLRLDPAPLGR